MAYDIVAAEIVAGTYKAGLQARAIAESEGDEARSKARYIELRALEIWKKQLEQEKKSAEEENLRRNEEGAFLKKENDAMLRKYVYGGCAAIIVTTLLVLLNRISKYEQIGENNSPYAWSDADRIKYATVALDGIEQREFGSRNTSGITAARTDKERAAYAELIRSSYIGRGYPREIEERALQIAIRIVKQPSH